MVKVFALPARGPEIRSPESLSIPGDTVACPPFQVQEDRDGIPGTSWPADQLQSDSSVFEVKILFQWIIGE